MPTESEIPVANIVKLQATDLPQLENLLKSNALPTEDCKAQLEAFFGIFDNDRLVAAGGLEMSGEHALLRSIVVDQAYRSIGLASALTNFFVAEAGARGLRALYLLTETADRYFSRFGFEVVERDQAPPKIAETRQFAGLCPQSAVFMRLTLDT